MKKILQKFEQRAQAVNSLLCVGLDGVLERIPAQFVNYEYPLFAFNRWIIEQTHPYVCAYKPNIAFYEARGDRGISSLRMTLAYLQQHHPEILTICDAKRGDVDSTSAAYAAAVFDWLGVDAVTLNPYLGRDALLPFLDRADKACIILCRTSNPGARDFQDLQVDGKAIWQIVAEKVAGEWNEHGNCMLVTGATYPDDLRVVRQIAGEMTLLVPGIGAQGGEIEAVTKAGLNHAGMGLIINAARRVIYAEDPGAVARELRDEINRFRP